MYAHAGGGRISLRARAGVRGEGGGGKTVASEVGAIAAGLRLHARAGGGRLSPHARAGAAGGERKWA